MQLLKLSQTAEPICFLIVQSSDHITGLTGASPTVTISKAGAAFGSPSGAVTEVGSGWYKIAGNSSDSGTLGPLLVHYTATSGDPGDVVCQVVAYDPESASVVASSVTGAVGSVTGAVGSVTGAVGSVTGNVGGNVVGSVASVTAAVTLSAADSPNQHSGTAQAGAASTITLAAGASAVDQTYRGETVKITSGTGAGQSRMVQNYVGSTKVVTVNRAWATNPDSTSVYTILATDVPKVDASLQVTATLQSSDTLTLQSGTAQAGAASTITLAAAASAVDTTYVGASVRITSGTGLGQVRRVTAYNGTTKVATVDFAWTTAPDSTSVYAVQAVPGPALNSSLQDVAASVAGAVGSVTGAVGSVTGAVGSVTAAVTVGTNNDKTGYTASTVSDKTGYSLAADQAVNVTKVNGTAQTARDLGASVLISPGTGAGQLDVTSGVIKANLAQILGTALSETAGQIAAAFKKFYDIASPTSTMNTITAVTTVGSVTGAVGSVTGAVGSVTGAVGSVTGNVGGSVVGSVASVSGAVGSVTGNVGGSVASVTADVGITQAGADKVWSTTVRKLSVEGVQAVWDALTSALTTVGSIGKRIADNLDTTVSSRGTGTGDATLANQTTLLARADVATSTRLATSGYTAPDNADIATILTRTDVATSTRLAAGSYTAPDNADIIAIKAKTDNLPADPASNTEVDTRLATGGYTAPLSAAATANAVWNEATSSHQTTGTTGKALTDADSGGGGGDPWPTVLPNDLLYPLGTAGYILGHNLDVPVSSRASAGTVEVTILDPGTLSGLLRLTIGQSYGAAHGAPAVSDTLPNTAPDLSGATVTLQVGLHDSATPLITATTVVSGPTSAQVLTTVLTSTQTGLLSEPPTTLAFAYWADWGGTPADRLCVKHGPVIAQVAP